MHRANEMHCERNLESEVGNLKLLAGTFYPCRLEKAVLNCKKTSKDHFCEAISAAISSLEKAERYISICEISGMGRGKKLEEVEQVR